MSRRLKMSLSLDLDNKWSYLKTHGSDSWNDFPTYLHFAVPRILSFLKERNLKITFFIVGQDAALEKHNDALTQIAEAGHEIASHSFNHDPWLHLYNEQELDEELERAENAIEQATGVRVRGFRGPGFSLSEGVLRVLKKRGYEYDATAFPNVLNPLARAFFFARSNLSKEEKQQRKALFGSFSDAFRPVKPYRWDLGTDSLLELPVTTMPIFKTPIHFSYLLYLATYSTLAAHSYLKFAMTACRMTRTSPSLLLHPLDFLGEDDDKELAFFPAMNILGRDKVELMHGFFDLLLKRFKPLTIGQHVEVINNEAELHRFEPNFST